MQNNAKSQADVLDDICFYEYVKPAFEKGHYDVIIIGANLHALNAALLLIHFRFRILIIDDGSSFITVSRLTDRESYNHNYFNRLKRSVFQNPNVNFLSEMQMVIGKANGKFAIQTLNHGKYYSRKLIVASGVSEIKSNIEGLENCYSVSVFQDPFSINVRYSLDWVAVYGEPGYVVETALLLKRLTNRIAVLTNNSDCFSGTDMALLEKKGILIIDRKIKKIQHVKGRIKSILFEDHSTLPVLNLFYKGVTEFTKRIDFTDHKPTFSAGGLIVVDDYQTTSIPGMYAIGPVYSAWNELAVYSGMVAARKIASELVAEKAKER